jgi:hypothetical protein
MGVTRVALFYLNTDGLISVEVEPSIEHLHDLELPQAEDIAIKVHRALEIGRLDHGMVSSHASP